MPGLPRKLPHHRAVPCDARYPSGGATLPARHSKPAGVFNQQIFGSKRGLRSVEDFTEFEQRTAYFNETKFTQSRRA